MGNTFPYKIMQDHLRPALPSPDPPLGVDFENLLAVIQEVGQIAGRQGVPEEPKLRPLIPDNSPTKTRFSWEMFSMPWLASVCPSQKGSLLHSLWKHPKM